MISLLRERISSNWVYILTASILLPFYIHIPLLVLTVIYLIVKNHSIILNVFTQQKWLSIFIIYVLIVSLLNRNFFGAFITLAFFIFTVYFSSYIEWLTVERYLKILNVLSLGSILVAFIAFYDYLAYVFNHGYGVFYIFQYANVQTRAEATFFNANYYGLFCVLAIVISLYLLFKQVYNKKFKYLYMLAIVSNFIAIILTASRTLLPVLAVVVVWFVFWTQRRYFWWVLGLSLLAGIYIILNPALLPRLTSIDYAFEDRINLWSVGLDIFKSHPLFGRGAMSYMNFYYLYTDKADMHAHNIYINTLADYGIVGLGILALLLKDFAKTLLDLVRNHKYRREFALLSSFVLAVLMHGLIDVSIFWLQTGYIFIAVCLIPWNVIQGLGEIE